MRPILSVNFFDTHTAPPAPHRSPAIRWLVHMGGIGLFAVSALDASLIPLPLPGSTDLLLLLLVVHRGNAVLMAAVATLGSVTGAYTTWSAGRRGGEAMLHRYLPAHFMLSLANFVKRYGVTAVGISALLPPPVPLMPMLLSAGVSGVPRRKFLIAFSLARALRYGGLAWLGATYGRRFVRAWTGYVSGWAGMAVWFYLALLVAAIVFGVWRYRKEKTRMLTGNLEEGATPSV